MGHEEAGVKKGRGPGRNIAPTSWEVSGDGTEPFTDTDTFTDAVADTAVALPVRQDTE